MATGAIQAIDSASIHRLSSGQVVIDLETAVKELIENALDAGAVSIDVSFRDYGVESFEVRDNGSGINQADWEGIATKHCTSKLTTFSDLTTVQTLGFRGEALSSLCGTATLSLTTSTVATAPMGTNLTFSKNGECQVGAKVARARGTSVLVKDLFASLPVRRKDLEKNAIREFKKALGMVQSYAMIRTGCRFTLSNTIGQGKQKMELLTPASQTVRSNFAAIFPGKSSPLIDLALVLTVEADKSVLKWADAGAPRTTQVLVRGLISKPSTGSGRGTGDRQFFYINGRPFFPSKISRAVNEVYRTFNTGSFPIVVADFQLPNGSYDVNVSPDKRTIFLHSELNLIIALKVALEEMFQPYRSTFVMSQIGPSVVTAKGKSSLADSSAKAPIKQEPSSPVKKSAPTESKGKRKAPEISPSPPDLDEVPRRLSKRERLLSSDPSEMQGSRAPNPDLEMGEDIPNPFDENGGEIVRARRPGSGSMGTEEEEEMVEGAGEEEQEEAEEVEMEKVERPFKRVIPQVQTILDTSGASWTQPLPPLAPRKSSVEKEGKQAKGKGGFEIVGDSLREKGVQVEGRYLKRDRLDEIAPLLQQEGAKEGEVDELEEEEEEFFAVKAETGIVVEERTAEGEDDVEVGDTSVGEGDLSMTLEQDRLDHLDSLDHSESTTHDSIKPDEFRNEFLGVEPVGEMTLTVDFASIAREWSAAQSGPSEKEQTERVDVLDGAAIDEKGERAEATLSRVVSKEDFEKMEVIGQFNLGFIIVRRRVSAQGGDLGGEDAGAVQDDLFIVDQHASDEKYNFERLQETTVIQSQRLISPRELNLPSQDEMTAIEHRELLKMNGFELIVDEDAEVGKRVLMISQPVSKGTVFGVEDFEELLDLVKQCSGGTVRPSKVRKMFASRACRMSVMIGKALTQNQMTAILRHMGTMDQPWACPHGRPTMRWLAGLGSAQKPDTRSDIPRLLDSLSFALPSSPPPPSRQL